jgi:hypothetical protein
MPVGTLALLLLGLEDVGRALVAGQQIGPVFGGEEGVKRLDPPHDPDEVVVAEREDGVDEIVALALIAEEDLQAVGEEGDDSVVIFNIPIDLWISQSIGGWRETMSSDFFITSLSSSTVGPAVPPQ